MHPLTDADCLLWRRRALTVARRLGAPSQEWEDLAQEGMTGLLRACRRFDPSRGLQFSTFAYPHVIGAVKDAMRRAGGRHEVISLEDALPDLMGEPLTFADVLPAPDVDADAGLDLRTALAALPERQRFVLLAMVVGGWKQREVGDALGVTCSRAGQIKAEALKRLRFAVA